MGISALLASQILDASATGRSVLTGADASAIRSTLGLGTLATQSATITDYLTIASAASTYQPLDSDLTSIAALSTTAFGRSLLTEASATTARSTLGLGTLATQSPTGTPSASTFLRGDFSWQTIDLSGYVPYSGATGAVNLGANALTASRATLATGTITASTPAIDITQTWNNAATTFTGILANVTDTASNASSLLMDLQVGGSSRFGIRKSNYRMEIGADGNGPLLINMNNGNIGFTGNLTGVYGSFGSFGLSVGGAQGGAGASHLASDAANTLAQRNSTNAQTFRIYNTFTDASNYERAKIAWESNILRIGTEKAGTGSARALELQTDGTTRLTIGATGLFTIADALNIAVGTTTGTKIGTATTQKLGFWNATPVVQPTAVADATDAASVITQLNALLSRMRDLGLIAT